MALDRSVLWRAALAQALSVAALAVTLAALLPRSFFEDHGSIAGPASWLACAALTARLVHVPARWALAGAALAGLPSGLATVLGVHWLGAILAIGLFAAWCAALAGDGRPA